ncbi:MAG: DEAD/DEAH box helicase [Planctomycetota bacterium]
MPNKKLKKLPKPDPTNPWGKLGLSPEILSSIRQAGFEQPTDIQCELIPAALAGHDCLGQAKTGTGKTAAFAIPMIQLLKPDKPAQALVLVPTRELAAQVDEHVRALGVSHPYKTALLYGGRPIRSQTARLKHSPEIIIGTPGRIIDLMRRRILDLSKVTFVVLDEIDRMLDIGFRDDIRRILGAIKCRHQTVFVSATVTDEIRRLAKSYMHEPQEIDVSRDTLTVESVNHGYVSVDPHEKFQTLLSFLRHEKPTLAIVFTNTKHAARRVADRLKRAGVNCKEIHGDLMQSQRERVMRSFRQAHIHVLVATDLAARGLDVMEISHIVNYDVPEDTTIYIHRIGRTARMGKSGYAVTFVCPDQGKLLTDIEKLINQELPQFQAPWVAKRQRPEPPPAAETEEAKPATNRSERLLQRCERLESSGLRPIKRTLGSRFRTTRRRR